jgi:hypothetical protein
MKLTEERRAHIDSLTYIQLLRKWRFSPSGDEWFQGETGRYWATRMKELVAEGVNHTQASKIVGWGD